MKAGDSVEVKLGDEWVQATYKGHWPGCHFPYRVTLDSTGESWSFERDRIRPPASAGSYCYRNERLMDEHRVTWSAAFIAVGVYASLCTVIGFAVWATGTGWPLLALVLTPSIKTGKAASNNE